MPTNKKIGNDFEREFCEMLYKEGFWVHNLAMNSAGQPADVIAVRNGKAFLIDCKVCSNGGFKLDRIEDNQETSMNLWRDCNNGYGLFAMLIDGEVYIINALQLFNLKDWGRKVLSAEWFKQNAIPFRKWVELCK